MGGELNTTTKVTGKDLRSVGIVLAVLSCGFCAAVGFFAVVIDSPDTSEEVVADNAPGEVAGEEVENAEPERQSYIVSEIVDGDTIKIEYGGSVESVRLIGIDSPEFSGENGAECFAQQSKDGLAEMIEGKSVYIEFDDSQGERDKYDRLLLYVFRADDELLTNDRMVREGFAGEYTYDSAYKYQQQFRDAQVEAENGRKGLWGDACACEEGEEKSRVCSKCNVAEVTYTNQDCSTYMDEVVDESCTEACATAAPTPAPVPVPVPTPAPTPAPPPSPSYTCDCSKTCSEMSSCEEAYYQLKTCGCGRRDGDNDGVPCEDICPGG